MGVIQGTAHEEIRRFLDDLVSPDDSLGPPPAPERIVDLETVDGNHGRIETRRYGSKGIE